MTLDIVYPLKRAGGDFRELRYSMRSLRHVPHDRVFVVGGKPGWASPNIIHLDSGRQLTRYQDSSKNIRTACLSDQVSDPFILMNDDFFILRDIEGIPDLNRGAVRQVAQSFLDRGVRNAYVSSMVETLVLLESSGYINPLSFELHAPLVVRKNAMLHALDLVSHMNTQHPRTVYGALSGMTGRTVEDVKVHSLREYSTPAIPFISTSDESFMLGDVGRDIRNRFPDPSLYEREGDDVSRNYRRR